MLINMKTYLLSPLLLFLLVHTSEALPLGSLARLVRRPVLKAIVRKVAKKVAEEVWQDAADNFTNQQNGPLPPAQAEPPDDSFHSSDPDDIHLAKLYLSSYGYISGDPQDQDDSLNEETTSAIKEFQQFFNLTPSGRLDNETLQQMSWQRCAVPDKDLTYDLSATNNLSWPLGTKWFPNNGGTSNNLTYGFAPDNELQDVVIKVFQDSFQRWSDAIGVLNLTEADYNVADIRIGFHDFSDSETGIWLRMVGGTVIQLQEGDDHHSQEANNDNNVTFGSMVLDGGKLWAMPTYEADDLSWRYDIVDLQTVVMHQIGHLLGLSHSSQEDSVMYPNILPSKQRKVELSDDDKEQIQQVYFSGRSSGVTLVGTSWGLLTTTLSLGFAACMVLFY